MSKDASDERYARLDQRLLPLLRDTREERRREEDRREKDLDLRDLRDDFCDNLWDDRRGMYIKLQSLFITIHNMGNHNLPQHSKKEKRSQQHIKPLSKLNVKCRLRQADVIKYWNRFYWRGIHDVRQAFDCFAN